MSESHEAAVRRILVAIDSSPHGSVALEAAARLATELRAELHGLFIEDINLVRLAGLPFAREIDYSSGTSRPLDIETMEQALRARAEGVRLAIAEAAQRTSLHWSFRISRGNLAQTMLAETLEADLLLIGRERDSPASSSATDQGGPIMVIDDGSCSSHRVFDTAARLAHEHADTIVALVTCNDGETASQHAGVSSHFYLQRCSNTVEALLRAVRQWRPQLLLIDRSSAFVTESTISALVTQLPCPLALVQ
jgi:nucleotide-binding universal stress UspA family protein